MPIEPTLLDVWCTAHPSDDGFEPDFLEAFRSLARSARLDLEVHASGWLFACDRFGHRIAAASAPSTILLHHADHPSAILTANRADAPSGFVFINPRPQDTTFLRGHNLLREAFQRAASAPQRPTL